MGVEAGLILNKEERIILLSLRTGRHSSADVWRNELCGSTSMDYSSYAQELDAKQVLPEPGKMETKKKKIAEEAADITMLTKLRP